MHDTMEVELALNALRMAREARHNSYQLRSPLSPFQSALFAYDSKYPHRVHRYVTTLCASRPLV